MIRQEEVYRIGKIGKPHGVKGEVTLRFSDDVFDRVEAEYLVLDVEGISLWRSTDSAPTRRHW